MGFRDHEDRRIRELDEKRQGVRERGEPHEKRSWRELDLDRDRGSGISRVFKEKTERGPSSVDKRAQAAAKSALQDLFNPGKKSDDQAVEWKKVCQATGKLFSTRASKYVEKWGEPRNWDDLFRLLDHAEAGFLSSMIDRVMALAASETPIRRELLEGKLRVLRLERDEPPLVVKIEKALEDLRALS